MPVNIDQEQETYFAIVIASSTVVSNATIAGVISAVRYAEGIAPSIHLKINLLQYYQDL